MDKQIDKYIKYYISGELDNNSGKFTAQVEGG